MSRTLDQSEISKLVSQAKAAEIDAKVKSPGKWPGTFNLQLIAEAVNKRRQSVDLESSDATIKQFSIRYDEQAKAIFIKPADRDRDGFAPCGWIEYKTLKEVLAANE